MAGNEITSEPAFYAITIAFPADKYNLDEIEGLAGAIDQNLVESEIYHTKPEITNIYV